MTQPPPGWQPSPDQEPPPGWQPPPGSQSAYGQPGPRYPGLPPQPDPGPGPAYRNDPTSQWGADKRLYFQNPVFLIGIAVVILIPVIGVLILH